MGPEILGGVQDRPADLADLKRRVNELHETAPQGFLKTVFLVRIDRRRDPDRDASLHYRHDQVFPPDRQFELDLKVTRPAGNHHIGISDGPEGDPYDATPAGSQVPESLLLDFSVNLEVVVDEESLDRRDGHSWVYLVPRESMPSHAFAVRPQAIRPFRMGLPQ